MVKQKTTKEIVKEVEEEVEAEGPTKVAIVFTDLNRRFVILESATYIVHKISGMHKTSEACYKAARKLIDKEGLYVAVIGYATDAEGYL